MNCLSPLSLPRPNGSGARDRVSVPCGKCTACKSNYAQEWSTRLKYELKHCKSAHFVTMTYTDSNIRLRDSNPTLDKRDCQLFMKRLRKNNAEKIKYYLCGEYGEETQRPHYHMIIFGLTGNQDAVMVKLLKAWQLGMIHIGKVNGKTITYTLKYMIKSVGKDYENIQKPFALISKNPAIGSGYIESRRRYHEGQIDNMHYVGNDGIITTLPKYYREKLYTKEEREEHGINARSIAIEKQVEEQEKRDNYFQYEVDKKEDYKRRKEKNHKKGKL